MVHDILSYKVASISELKANPMATIKKARGEALAILNRNEPVFYCIPPRKYEAMLDMLEDMELTRIVKEREGGPFVEVNLDDV